VEEYKNYYTLYSIFGTRKIRIKFQETTLFRQKSSASFFSRNFIGFAYGKSSRSMFKKEKQKQQE
jgi:hypothetical protein